jgi:diguanylate cyclase (GGDEF)-like protein
VIGARGGGPRPWSGNSQRATVVFVASITALLYLALVVAHLLVQHGTPRLVLVPVAGASSLLAAVVAVAAARRRIPDHRLGAGLTTVAALPLANALVHMTVTDQIVQTSVVMLSIVAIGAVVRPRAAFVISALAIVVWALVVAGEHLGPGDLVVHFGTGMVLAAVLAYVVFEVRARSERQLREARDDLDAVAAVARCGQSGLDPRPVVLDGVRRRAGAAWASWVERDGEHLVAPVAAGLDLSALRIRIDEAKVISRALLGAERVFVADATAPGPDINPQLVAVTGAASLLCEPVLHDGHVTAVLVVGWRRRVAHLDDHAVAVVATLAAEAGAAVAANTLRDRLESLVTTDPMTGIANRRGWNARLEVLTARARRTGQPLTLALADLDHFKAFNDTYGHDAGDELLQGFAAAARAQLRPTDVMARWGGEEFALALSDCTEAEAVEILERVRAAVPSGQTCSIGLSRWRTDEKLSACLGRADAAMYRAKQAGRNRIST